MEIRALLKRNGNPTGEWPLTYAGTRSQFEASITLDEPGAYEAIVYAYDPSNGNTGLDTVTFIISE